MNTLDRATLTKGKSSVLLAIGIFALALIVRFVYLVDSSTNPSFATPLIDSESYHLRALGWAEGKEMSEGFFWQSPFYPAFLAFMYFISGSSILFAKVIQLILGSMTCVLTYRLGEKIFDRPIGIVAGVINALYGPLIFFEAELLSTGWATLWSVILLLLLLYTEERRSLSLCWILGLCGGLSVITRATFLPFFVAGCTWLIVCYLRSSMRRPQLLARVVAICAGFLLIVLPTALQSKHVSGHFSFLPASGGVNLYLGNNPDLDKTLTIRPGLKWDRLMLLPHRFGVTEGMWESQKFFYDKFWTHAALHPFTFFEGLAKKMLRIVSSREIPRNLDIYLFRTWSSVLQVSTWKVGGWGFPFGLLLPFALVGLVYHWNMVPTPMKLLMALIPMSIILVFVASRYRVVLVPSLAILAAGGFPTVVHLLRSYGWRTRLLLGGYAFTITLLMSLPGPFVEEEVRYEAELHHFMGCARQKSGYLDEAREHFLKAIQINPEYADAHFRIGTLLTRRERNEEGLQYLRKALLFEPDIAKVHNNLGIALAKMGNLKEAELHFREATRLEPYLPESFNNLARALKEMGRNEDAAKYFQQGARIGPAPKPFD